MKTFLKFILILFPLSLYSFTLYLITEQGEIAYSTDKGVNWSWKTSYLPMTPAVDITSNKYGNLYYVSKNGEVYKSTDQGNSWVSVQNLSMSDAVAIWVDSADTVYVLGEKGDLYTSAGGWSLKLNLGLSDFVDLFPNVSSGLLAVTSSGDVVSISGSSASIIGNIGVSNIIAGAVKNDTIFVITYEGDVARSIDGQNYEFIGTLSQVGITGLVAVKNDSLYIATEGGEVAQSLDGSNWTFKGSANQVYIAGITSDSVSALGVEELFFALSVNEEGILIKLLSGATPEWDIYKTEEKGNFHFLTTVKNSKKYLDKEVEPGKRYGYKLKVEDEWFGPLWIEFPEKFKERIISVYPNPASGKLVLFIFSNKPGEKEIFISDVAGRKERLFKGFISKGNYKLELNIKDKKGVYFIIFGEDKEKVVLY